jgi:hypothetical protein
MRRMTAACGIVLAVAVSIGFARSQEPTKAAKTPEVVGAWTGTWGIYNPADAAKEGAKKNALPPMRLDCKVAMEDGKWQATFEGECGRPYKYTIKMEGRQAGSAVLFKGTTDLGEMDGGVFDWIGRATDKEFIGFYTSGKYAGTFQLKRGESTAKAAAQAK